MKLKVEWRENSKMVAIIAYTCYGLSHGGKKPSYLRLGTERPHFYPYEGPLLQENWYYQTVVTVPYCNAKFCQVFTDPFTPKPSVCIKDAPVGLMWWALRSWWQLRQEVYVSSCALWWTSLDKHKLILEDDWSFSSPYSLPRKESQTALLVTQEGRGWAS